MVRYGHCVIRCNTCRKGCSVYTQTDRNKGWEPDVLSQTCEHFRMQINMYTRYSWSSVSSNCIRFEAQYTPIKSDKGGIEVTASGDGGHFNVERSGNDEGLEVNPDGEPCSVAISLRNASIAEAVNEGVMSLLPFPLSSFVSSIRQEYLHTEKY